MTNKVTIKSTKEPVRLRVKNLANGVQSLYLDCYVDGKRSHSTGCQRYKDDPYS